MQLLSLTVPYFKKQFDLISVSYSTTLRNIVEATISFLIISCTVAVLNFEALSSDQFTLPGGCYGMHKKNNFNGDIHSASYTNNDGCEAYLTYRQVIHSLHIINSK